MIHFDPEHFKFSTNDPASLRKYRYRITIPVHEGLNDGFHIVSLCGIRFQLIKMVSSTREVTCKRCLKEINR